MRRRDFLIAISTFGLGCAGYKYWPEEGIWNPCHDAVIPPHLLNHPIVRTAWEGIDTAKMWDCHVHLIGTGDSDSGTWVNPNMESIWHPIQYTQLKFYLNAGCTDGASTKDKGYIHRLLSLKQGMPHGTKFMLLAFDYFHDNQGRRIRELTPFHSPNEYAARLARSYPDHFEWIASIHPYREDCIEVLEKSVAQGARAVKWLPAAMGIDPSSAKCDRFYAAAKRLNIPLLIHVGAEYAVHVKGQEGLTNPLILRRPLEQGVKVIAAHCASLGSSPDTDMGPNGAKTRNIELFARLMDDPRFETNLFGDISAVTQVNRDVEVIAMIIRRQDWHHRLLQGSDYPLPGIMPVFSVNSFAKAGYLPQEEVEIISQLRLYNPSLFDFILKRRLNVAGLRLDNKVFETRRFFVTS